MDELGFEQENSYAPLINRGEQAKTMAYCAGVERLVKR